MYGEVTAWVVAQAERDAATSAFLLDQVCCVAPTTPHLIVPATVNCANDYSRARLPR
jgi:hypothetical protein